jgi:hypothetical protein
MNKIAVANELVQLAKSLVAAWMPTSYYKAIGQQSHTFLRNTGMMDKQASDLLQDLNSPIYPQDVGTILRKTRVLKQTLRDIGEQHGAYLEQVEGLEDELMRRAV